MRLDSRMSARERDSKAVAKDPIIEALLTKDPDQVQQYVENNVSSLQEARTLLASLAKAVAFMAQREFK